MNGLTFDSFGPSALELQWEELHANGDCGGLAENCPVCSSEKFYGSLEDFDVEGFWDSKAAHGPVKIFTPQEIEALYPNREYRPNAR